MGTLAHFDVGALMARYGLLHFVETGTGRGEGLAHAARFGFRTLRSCESVPVLAQAAQEAFASDSRVSVYSGHSRNFLDHVCADTPIGEPILFWLDAHFPGADYGLAGYGAEPDENMRLPLPQELVTIAAKRPQARDVILIDDLRIWQDGPFGSGNLPPNVRPWCPKMRDSSFFLRLMGAEYGVKFDFADEGYVTLTPKEAPHA
jgi:hypothetical protein